MSRMPAFGLLALVWGCATGFDRGAIQERLSGDQLQVSNQHVSEVLALKPQVRFPFKLGIYLDSGRAGYSERSPRERIASLGSVEWRVADKEKVLAALDFLKGRGVLSDAFYISTMTASGGSLEEVRVAAARHGADAVLVVRGVSQVDRYVNPLCLLNILILPGWLVPASHRDALVVVASALWDVRNGYLYATAEAEGTGSVLRPSFTIDDQQAIERAKEKALADFAAEVARRIEGLKSTAEDVGAPDGSSPAGSGPRATP